MSQDMAEMLHIMDSVLQEIEAGMPKPKFVKLPYGMDYRFEEKDIYTALILKLARIQSAIRAAWILLDRGYTQEQIILHRVIDETVDDIFFLVYGLNDGHTELHEQFLEYFWEEEIDESGTMLDSKQKRGMVSRNKIRAYLSNVGGHKDPSTALEASRTVHKAYSGFVHGAAPQIMNMYGGNPPKFQTKGLLGSPRIEECYDDLWNYVYRGFIAYLTVLKVLGWEKHVQVLTRKRDIFMDNRNPEK